MIGGRRLPGVALLAVLALCCAAAAPAAAKTFTVRKTADSGSKSLRAAVDKANTHIGDDVIVLRPKPGQGKTFKLTRCGPADSEEDLNANGDLDYTDTATLKLKARKATLRNTCPGERILSAAGTTTVLGATLTKGDSVGGGGAILASGVLRVRRSTLTDNVATGGGGGGARLVNGGSIADSVIRGNTGGGIDKSFNALTIERTTISGNHATSTSGASALRTSFGETTITDSAITGNSGSSDPAISKAFNPMTLINSTVSENEGGGVAILSSFDSTVLKHTTVANNEGAGIAQVFDNVEPSDSIIAGNGGAQCSGAIVSSGYNIASDASCGLTDTGDQPSTDPKLLGLARNGGPTKTMALRGSSPAVNEGNPDPPACTKADQRGAPRAGRCDIGAYERIRCEGAVVNRVGTSGDDRLRGTKHRDGIIGLGGADSLIGGKGDDGLCGGKGHDSLKGGKGPDELDGGPQRDRCDGGPGSDRARRCERQISIP